MFFKKIVVAYANDIIPLYQKKSSKL